MEFNSASASRIFAKSPAPAIAAIAPLAVIWGYNWIMMKIGVAYAPPFTFSALRSVLGALVLFGIMAVLRRSFAVRALPHVALIGLLQTTGFIGFSTWALSVAGAGKTVVLVYTMPFWIVLFGWLILGERVRGLQWPALGFALVGLIMLLNPQTGGTIGGDPIVWSPAFILALAYNVIPASACVGSLEYALRRLPAGTAGMAILANPLVGVSAAWLQLGERPGPIELGGMLLVGLALVLVSAQGLREQRAMPNDGEAVAAPTRSIPR